MGNYVSVADVRLEGVPDSVSNARIESRIAKWEAIVEKVTRNVFRVLTPGELIFDGSNSDILHFDIPLVEVTSVIINEEETELDSDEYRAYTGKSQPQDDRTNPKIILTGNRTNSLFRRTHGMFYKGLDQAITASWGYVDDDPDNPGSYITPPPIVQVLTELVALDLDGYFESDPSGKALSSIRRERTDGHELEYQIIEDTKVIWNFIPRSIADILSLYRSPWIIDAPDNRYYAGRSLPVYDILVV